MIKNIFLFSILWFFSLNFLYAQNTNSEIKINLEDFDVKNLNESDRVLLNILIQRSVDQLEADIKQLDTDKELGRISEEEYIKKKEIASNANSDKIEQSIDILTESEPYINASTHLIDSFHIDNINIQYKKDQGNRSISIQFDNDGDCDTTKTKKKSILRYRDEFYVGIGFTNWRDNNNERYDDPETKLSGGSSMYYEIGVKLSTFLGKENPDRMFKYRSRTSFNYGLTFISRYYHFNDKTFSINKADNGVSTIDDVQITKSVFSQTALEAPITLTHYFGKKVRSSFSVTAGLYGGINLRTRQKIKYSVDNEDYKAKWISDFNTNRVYAGAIAKIGFGNMILTGRYNFTKLFKSSSDIEVYPYTIGLTVEL